VEEARRTLVRLLPLKDSTTRTFDTQKLGTAKSSSYLLPVFLGKALDHKYRETRLGRMALPIVRLTEPEVADDEAEPAKRPADMPKNAFQGLMNRTVSTVRLPAVDLKRLEGAPGNWLPETEYKLSAEFGQVLFPLDHTDPSKAIEAALVQPSRSPFSPTFPGLSSLLVSPDLTATARLKIPSLLYDFLPSPDQPNFESGQMFPSLHIQMRTGRNGQAASIHKISLGFQSHIHDVLLPDKTADVRFYRTGRLRYRANHKDQNIREWTDAVIANIESGGRLTAPPLKMDIPKWTIPGFPADAKGARTIIYHFSGVQFRQSVTGDLLGEAISYSTVQSGKLGAKGGALTAHYNGYGDTQLQDEVAIKAFVETAFKMVDIITDASTQTQPISRQIRPRDENSQRKNKRMVDAHGMFDRVAEYPAQGPSPGKVLEKLRAREAEAPIEKDSEAGSLVAIAEETAQDAVVKEPSQSSQEEKNARPAKPTDDQFPS
jgi:hypothetical protein